MLKRLVGLAVACAVVAGASVARGQCEGRFVEGPWQERPGVYGATTCAVEWDPDGEGPLESWLVVAGDFTIAGFEMVRGVAAWDGVAWRRLGDTAFQWPTDLAVFRGDLFLTAVGPNTNGTNRLWRWNGAGWIELQGGGVAGQLHVMGDELFVGAGAVIRGFNGTSFRTLGTPIGSGHVAALSDVEGVLHAAVSGTNQVFRWVGSAWQALGAGHGNAGSTVSCIGEFAGETVIGGILGGSGGTSTSVKRWTGSSWEAMGGYIGECRWLSMYNGELHACTESGTRRWSGGAWVAPSFPSFNRERFLTTFRGELVAHGATLWRDNQFYGYTARYDGETWWPLGSGLAQRSDPGALFGVRALASNGSSLFAAGSFGQVLPERVQNIGRWTGARWEGLGAGFASDYLFPPCLLADGEGVIVGGPFVAPLSVRNVARWEAGNWVQLGDGWPGVPVKRLARWAGSVVASGGAKIGVWNGDQWIEIAAQVNGEVNGLLEYGGELIAAGGFTEIDGEPLRGVARWDGTVWRPLGSGVDGVAYAACVLSGELYVSTPFNGQTPGGATMMRWDGDRWEAVPNTIGSYTGFLGTYEGRLIARGISNVLRFDGSTWVALDGPADGNVLAMCEHDGALVLGGSFATIGGLPANAVAMYRRNAEANRIVQQPWVAAHPHPYRGSMRAGLASVVRMTGAFSCSWIRNGVQVSWTSLGASGTPATDYTLAQTVTFSVADVNTYVLRIRDDCGTFESAPLVFDYTGSCGLADIGQAGGIDGADQLLDNNDFVVFIDRFFLGDVRADLSGPGGGAADGVLNNNDFIGFIDAFFAGCG